MSSAETLDGLVREKSRDHPDAAMLVGGGARRTWGNFQVRCARGADALRAIGLRRGDRVGILSENCLEWMEAFFAVHRGGGVVVPVNQRLTGSEMQWVIEDAGVSLLVGDSDRLAATSFSGPTLAFGPDYEGRLAGASATECEDAIRADDVAVIAYTSGTTGTPKGVQWSHRALLASACYNPFPAELAGGARILLCVPLYAGGAIIMACNALAIGATLVVARFEVETVLRALAEEGIEFTGMVPTMIALLVDSAPAGWRAPHLRRIYYGAGKMSWELFERAQRLFGCEFEQAYAMTETCILGTRLAPADHRPERIGSAGKPMVGVEMKIAGEDGVELPVGTAGEIVIRSPGNMLGYWRDGRANHDTDTDADGWFRTRDIGRFDDDGYLYLVDRKDDMVKSGGFSVSPAEVEGVLTTHAAVAEAAVIGLPDERWGERVAAVVRVCEGAVLKQEALTALCRSRLAAYKIPRTIVFAEAPLPRTGLGKVNRRAVRKQYQGLRVTRGIRAASGERAPSTASKEES